MNKKGGGMQKRDRTKWIQCPRDDVWGNIRMTEEKISYSRLMRWRCDKIGFENGERW